MGRPKGPCTASEVEQRRTAARSRRPSRRPSRWKGEQLYLLHRDYERGIKVDAIARYHGTSRGHLMRLAKLHGWKRRQIPLPEAARQHWNTYRNIQRIAGRAIALEAVAGIGQ